MSLARSGKKVALLEMDLHQPKLREIFDVPPSHGITDYLLGNVSEDEIIFPTIKHANVYLIPGRSSGGRTFGITGQRKTWKFY